MFAALRWKLTLINIAVITILFFLLAAGSYYYAQKEIVQRSQDFARRIIADMQAGRFQDRPPPREHTPGPRFFFVTLSQDGLISSKSIYQPLEPEQLNELVQQALHTPASQGTLTLDKKDYPFFKAPLPPGDMLLFQDFTVEKNMLSILLTALSVVGLTCLAISFLGSFFLAHRAMVPIQQAWQQQKSFLADASHELRTPLAVIQTNLEVVMDCPDETVASQQRWLTNIQEETALMARLVDDLLFLARADANQQQLDYQVFDFHVAIFQAISPFEPHLSAKGLKLSSTIVPCSYTGDVGRLKQILQILLDNAIRHTPAGGKIAIDLSCDTTKVTLSVSDTGEGIPADHLPKIFDRFHQVDMARNKGGAGLGLAIAKYIVECHNGSISVESQLGSGTRFTVQLPAKPAQG